MTLDVIKHHYQHRLWQWHGAITSTNADVLSIRPWGTSLKEILNEMRTFSLKKMHLKCCLQNTSHFSLVFIVKCALTKLATLLLQLTDGVVHDCSISSALAMQSCCKPLTCNPDLCMLCSSELWSLSFNCFFPQDYEVAELWKSSSSAITFSRTGLVLGLRPANERRRYKVTPSLIGWAQT